MTDTPPAPHTPSDDPRVDILPDAWVVVQDSEDQTTQVPTWHLDTLVPGRAIAAWANGVDIDGDLLEDVDAVERDALRVLAAVHAHRRHTGQDAESLSSGGCVWHVDPTEVEAGDVARWDAGPCMVFAERYWGRPRVSLAVQAPAELRDPRGLARALEAAAAWVDTDRRSVGGAVAAPARDDALARVTVVLPDPEGVERDGAMHWRVHDCTGDDEYGAEGETWTVQLDAAGVVHLDGNPIAPATDLALAVLAAARSRDRLGATTNTPEGGTDDR